MNHPFFASFETPKQHPFFSSFDDGENVRLGTATGRSAVTEENIQSNIDQLTELKKRAKPEQQARLDSLIERLKKQQAGWTRPVEGDSKPFTQAWKGAMKGTGIPGSDALVEGMKGVGTGIATGPVRIVEIASAAPRLVYSHVGDNLRSRLSEQIKLIEDTIDPEGVAGMIGEFAGEMPANMVAFEGTVGKIPGAKAWLTAPTTGGVVRRAGVSAAKGAVSNIPFAVLQAAGIDTENMSDRVKQFLIGTASAAAFSALTPQRKATAKAGSAGGKAEVSVDGERSVEVPILSKDELAGREAELAKLNAKAAADKAKREADSQMRRLAKAKWELDNPDKHWKDDMTSNQRKEWIEKFKTEYAPSEPTQPTTPVTPLEVQAVEAANRDLAAAEASGNQTAIQEKQAIAAVKQEILDKTNALKKYAEQFADPAISPATKDMILVDFKYRVQRIKQLGGQTAGYEDALANMTKIMQEQHPLEPFEVYPSETRPNLDKVVWKDPQGSKGIPDWAREKMLREGLDPGRSFNDIDIQNPSVRWAIENDPSLTAEQKANILRTGSPKSNDGVAPVVAEIAYKMKLRDQFEKIGLAFDASKPPDVLERQLEAYIRAQLKPSAQPKGQEAIAAERMNEPPLRLEDIVSPAVRDPKSGRVFGGAVHVEAMDAANKAGIPGNTKAAFEQGYVTKQGKFVPTEAAEALANAQDATLEHGPVNPDASQYRGAEVTGPLSPRTPASGGTGPSPSTSPAPHAVAVAVPKDVKLSTIDAVKKAKELVGEKKFRQIVENAHTEFVQSAKNSEEPLEVSLKLGSPFIETVARQIVGDEPITFKAIQQKTETFLKSIKHKKPLEQLKYKQLDQLETAIADAIEQADPTLAVELKSDLKTVQKFMKASEAPASPRPLQNETPESLIANRDALETKIEELSKAEKNDVTAHDLKDAQTRLSDIKKEIATRKVEAREAPKPVSVPKQSVKPAEAELPPISPADFRKAPSKLGDADLARQIDEINVRLSAIDPRDAEPWSKRLTKLVEEQSARQNKPKGPDGEPPISGELRLSSPPSLTAFVGGFGTGLWTGDPEDPEYLSRAFMWGLGSAGMVYGVNKYLKARELALKTSKKSSAIPGLDQFPKRVYTKNELKTPEVGQLTRARKVYQGIARSIDGLERVPVSRNTPTHKNPGQLAEMQGSFAAQSERWMTQKVDYINPLTGMDEPVLVNGEPVFPLKFIIDDLAKGDEQALNNLAVALSSAELAGRLGETQVPMPKLEREWIITHAPDWLMKAAKEFRKYHAAGLIVQNKEGLLSDEGLAKSLSEGWYTPMHRVLERAEKLFNRSKDVAPAQKGLFKRQLGSNKPVRAPTEVAADMTIKILRSAEYNRIVKTFVERAMELPKIVRDEIITPVSKSMNPHALNVDAAVIELRKFANISMTDAKGMLAYMDSEAIYGKPGLISYFKNGEIQSYRVNRDVFQAVKSMTPVEIDMLWRFVGFPARLASKGVVYSPGFTEAQFIMDSFGAWFNTEYGFRLGRDSFRGWWHNFVGSKQYQRLLTGGGPSSIQSLPYLQKEVRGEAIHLADVSPAKTALNKIKEMKLWDAYKTIILPVANAARVGEALRAFDHGASTIEAAYAAQNVLGNVRMQGHLQSMKIFNYITMFSRPAIAAMDKTLERVGWHPYRDPRYSKASFGQAMQKLHEDSEANNFTKMLTGPRPTASIEFLTKIFAGLVLPAAGLWYVNRDDEEINQARKTELGSRYWFFRAPDNTLIKIRRPQILGPLFAGGMEALLDKMYADDPKGTERVLASLWEDSAINVLPQIGVIPLSLMTNRKVGLGSPIIPGRDERTDPVFQGRIDATLPSRIIADKLADISSDIELNALRTAMSPAGLDYILGTVGGMLGQDALKAINAAIVYKQKGYLPAKEELPIISRLAVRYPSMNVKEVQEFYARDLKVQAAAGTIKDLAVQRPELLKDYFTHENDRIKLIKLHDQVRQKVADMRRAIDDLKNGAHNLPKELVDNQVRYYTELIIKHMKIANDVAAGLEKK